MSELRQNLATKEWVIIATERAKRPQDFVAAQRQRCSDGPVRSDACPFCPGNEEEDLEVLRMPHTGPWQVRIVGNRYPALASNGELVRHFNGVERHVSGVGYHEVIVESPIHNTCTALQQPGEVAGIIQAFIDRAWMVQNDPRVEYVLFFKNHGRLAGASLTHPHAQMMALPMVPSDMRMRSDMARQYFDETGVCSFCTMVQQELELGARIIAESRYFVAFAPYASSVPFNTWIMPKEHLSSFQYTQADEVEELGQILRSVLRKLYFGLNDPDYNYAIRTAPVRDLGAPYLHWYLTIVPRVAFAAGFEIGSGIFINPALPEDCAQFLRAQTE